MENIQMEDMKEMIRREVQSIGALKERVAFKEMIEGVFLALYEKNMEMYRSLEARVMDDLAYNMNRYRIRTGLVEKAYWDASHHLMTAVCEEDTKPAQYTMADIRSALAAEGKFRLGAVFFEGDVVELAGMLKRNISWSGVLQGEKAYPVTVCLEPGSRYLNKMEQLYHLFMKNGIPWKTINAPYLFKMLDVVLTALPEEPADGEAAAGFEADFGEYSARIRYDRIPVWNVWHLLLESVGFPVACGDHENYEHIISIRDYGAEHAYLAEDKAGIRSVRQSGDRLMVTGQIVNAKKWDIYMIRSGEDRRIDSYTYPVMDNLRRDGFIERFQNKTGQIVRTQAELCRFIRGFGLENYIEYQECRLEDHDTGARETYSMNFFMKDEIRGRKGRQYLILHFKPVGKEEWILRDVASFITSQVQELYPEYICRGKLV